MLETQNEIVLHYFAKYAVMKWYDGYQFGSSEIFNPWSVINYVDDHCYPKAFWQSTGSNGIIGDILAAATPEITENLRRLMQGETVTTYVDTGVIYPEVKKNQASIYSFLLVAGYLRCTEIIPQNDGNFMCRVSIPNKKSIFPSPRKIQKAKTLAYTRVFFGAPSGTRTRDTLIKSQVLYQLS